MFEDRDIEKTALSGGAREQLAVGNRYGNSTINDPGRNHEGEKQYMIAGLSPSFWYDSVPITTPPGNYQITGLKRLCAHNHFHFHSLLDCFF